MAGWPGWAPGWLAWVAGQPFTPTRPPTTEVHVWPAVIYGRFLLLLPLSVGHPKRGEPSPRFNAAASYMRARSAGPPGSSGAPAACHRLSVSLGDAPIMRVSCRTRSSPGRRGASCWVAAVPSIKRKQLPTRLISCAQLCMHDAYGPGAWGAREELWRRRLGNNGLALARWRSAPILHCDNGKIRAEGRKATCVLGQSIPTRHPALSTPGAQHPALHC